jgi:iron complex transport system substrate-binding protein
MRRYLLLAATLLTGLGATAAPGVKPQAAAGRPQRIVSLNLCADQLVIALADRDQIAGLTGNAADPDMSAEAARARGLPMLRPTAEQLVAIRPDLIVGMPATGSPIVAAAGASDARLVDLDFREDIATIHANIRAVAAAVGHPERGEALVRRMDTDLAAIRATGGGRVAAYYQRRGYLTGTGTLVDEMMRRAGLTNLAARLGKPPLAQVSLEEIVAAQPDFLIVESATDRVTDQGTEMLHHPAIADIPRIRVQQAWTVCAGPALVRAVRSVTAQLAAQPGG